MTPIHELLARMRWDSEFGRGRFELTYEDKLEGRLLREVWRNGRRIWSRAGDAGRCAA